MNTNDTAAPAPGAAARSETSPKPKTIKFEGLTLTLPAKMPFNVLRYSGQNEGAQVIGVLTELLGDDQLEQVWALQLDVDRGKELVDELMAAYGTTPGK